MSQVQIWKVFGAQNLFEYALTTGITAPSGGGGWAGIRSEKKEAQTFTVSSPTIQLISEMFQVCKNAIVESLQELPVLQSVREERV